MNRTSTGTTQWISSAGALVKDGKARDIGASSMWAWQFAKLQHTAEMHGWTKFISMAVHHPLVGEVTFTHESMELVADPGLTMFVYTTEPGSKSEEALSLLASWTATLDQAEPHDATDGA
jgi:aryl-alcohol dehydrogenase-like predicted oxidoreductase